MLKFVIFMGCFLLTGCYQAFSGSDDDISTRPTTNDLHLVQQSSGAPF